MTEPHPVWWRLQDLKGKFDYAAVDLTDYHAVEAVVQSVKPDVIFHCAAYGGMPHEKDSKIIYDINFYGTMNLLNACKKVGFSCFVNTGSSSEYGMKAIPMREDLSLEPLSDYAVAKVAATHYCLKEALFNTLPVYTVRPFSVYGDYELHSRLIPTVILSMLAGKTVELSAPYYVRDFIYIDDMIDLFMAVVTKKPTSHFVFNACSGVQSIVGDVVRIVQEYTRSGSQVQWAAVQARPWEPTHWQGDGALSHELLGWKAQYTLTQGLARSIEWFHVHAHLYGYDFSATAQTLTIQQPQGTYAGSN